MDVSSQVLTAAQMQAAEQALIDRGETVESLMERAGAGAAEWVWRLAAGRSVTVLCGPGNNGGDGYVIARVLAERGLPVSVIAPFDPGTDAARTARAKWGGVPVDHAMGGVVVDCLFGTGLGRPLSDALVTRLRELANAHELRVAIDLPSGVDSDTGAQLNDGLPPYDLTVCLGAWKRAHWLMPSAASMGARRLVDIGVDAVEGAVHLAQRPQFALPDAGSHKYSRGLVAVVGGAMPGAGILAARAAQHSGAGYVKLLAPQAHPALPADIVLDDSGAIEQALSDRRLCAVLIGPGLGRGKDARAKLGHVLQTGVPRVLDADALTLIETDMPVAATSSVLATPHEGELATLCQTYGIDAETKLGRAQALHEATGFTILAKGADNILAGPEGTRVFPPAPSWLSTAGTGDVLAGIAASRMACGAGPFEAAEEAVQLHAEAARIAGTAFSAMTLCGSIPEAYKSFL